MVSSLALAAAILAVSVSAQDVLVTTTVNQTHCVTSSNIGNFYHYGAAFATKGKKVFAIQYEAQNVTCCDFDLAYDVSVTIEDISSSASATPCSDHVECQTNGDCDPNATCVMGSSGSFMCQCTDLYEGNGFTCSRKPHWSEWSDFGPYSVSCGNGATRTRTRTCSKPPRCEGTDTDSEVVDLEACPVPTTTTLPPTRYQACGTRKCHSCSGGPSSCSNKGLDRDKDYHDLRGCPSGYQFHSYKKYPQWWPAADVYLRICSSIPPAPVARYRIVPSVLPTTVTKTVETRVSESAVPTRSTMTSLLLCLLLDIPRINKGLHA